MKWENGEVIPVNYEGKIGDGEHAVVIQDVLESEDGTSYAVKFQESEGPLGNDGQHRMFWVSMSRDEFAKFYQNMQG